MARFDDEDEKGHVVRGRVSRMLKLGGLTTSVSASMMGDKLLGSFFGGEGRAERSRKALERNAARIVKTMGEMKGAAMKLGQMLSVAPIDQARLPPEVKDALAVLQREAPPMTWAMVSRQVERAFDQPIDTVFKYFDPKPLAAASIGQVHRATLFDGTEVAVKIQYPDVAESLESDLKNMGALLQLGRAFADRKRLEAYVAEVREVILAESDYEAEGRNLQHYGELFSGRDDIRVPRPIPELTRRTVLTMEYIAGRKLDTALLELPPAERAPVAIRFIDLFAWMFHELQVLHADPHPGNFLLDDEGRFVLLDFGCVREFQPGFTDGFLELLAALWGGRPDRLPSVLEDLGFGGEGRGIDVDPKVLEGYFRIVLEPFLVEGEFDFGTWDPHVAARNHFLRNLEMVRLTPPADVIFFGRTCVGCWGFLQRMGVKGDFRELALGHARSRGVVRQGTTAASR